MNELDVVAIVLAAPPTFLLAIFILEVLAGLRPLPADAPGGALPPHFRADPRA